MPPPKERFDMTIETKLDTLADYQAQKDAAMLAKQELIDAILTPEIKAKIAEIEAEFAGKTEAVDANIAALTAAIKAEVLEFGASVKATFLHAVYGKGRVSWDTKAMDGYAVDHPEILFMRKEGSPSVSIRKV